MQISKTSKAFMHITNLAKMCCGPIALSAYICAAICLSPAAAEESQEAAENGEEIVENATTNEEETEATQIDYKKEAEASVLGASLEDEGDEQGESDEDSEETDGEEETESEETDGEDSAESGDDESVKEDTTTENSSNASIPAGSAGGGGGAGGGASNVSVPVEASETTEELDIPQDENADVIAEAIDIATETSENTGADYKVIAAVNSETEDSTSVTPIQQRFSSSSTDEGYTVSTGSTQQNASSVYLVSDGNDIGISTSSASGYSYAATTSTESVSTVSEIQDIVTTNKDVASGEVLAAKQSLIVYEPNFTFTPDRSVFINGTGSVQIGDAETTGVLHITSREGVTGSISDASISVTEGAPGVTDVFITRQNATSNTSGTLTNVHIDLSNIKNEVSFTVEAATLSATSFNMPTGTLNLVNHAGISPIGPSYLNNINIDSTSNFYGGSTPGVNVKGHVDVKLAPRTTASGGSDAPLAHGSTIENYQMYGLTLNTGATLNMDMKHIHVSESLSTEGGIFYVFMNGVRWDELTTGSYVTDLELLANTFSFTNLYDKFGKDIADRLVIRSGYYKSANQDMELIVELLPASVPEPTTATLSLLALSALAARRRRRV